MTDKVPFEEAFAVLRLMAANPAEIEGPEDQSADVDVRCSFRGWRLVFFNDEGQLDGLIEIEASDARRSEIKNWPLELFPSPVEPQQALTDAEQRIIADRFGLSL